MNWQLRAGKDWEQEGTRWGIIQSCVHQVISQFSRILGENMASNRNTSSDQGKRLLEELQQKASQLSTLLGSEAAKPSQAGSSTSSNRSYMPSFRRNFQSSSNPFRGKGKGKSVVKGPFMRDVIAEPAGKARQRSSIAKENW